MLGLMSLAIVKGRESRASCANLLQRREEDAHLCLRRVLRLFPSVPSLPLTLPRSFKRRPTLSYILQVRHCHMFFPLILDLSVPDCLRIAIIVAPSAFLLLPCFLQHLRLVGRMIECKSILVLVRCLHHHARRSPRPSTTLGRLPSKQHPRLHRVVIARRKWKP